MDCPKIPAASPPKSPPTSPLSRAALNEDWVLSLPYYQCLWIYLRSNATKHILYVIKSKMYFFLFITCKIGAHLRASSSNQPYGLL